MARERIPPSVSSAIGGFDKVSVLPDVLRFGLKVVFCGTASGTKSRNVGYYYAGAGNRFWGVLYETGLTPRKFSPRECYSLTKYGIGLTDLAKNSSGRDKAILKADFDIVSFRAKIEKFAPKVVAFNGKKAAKVFLKHIVNYGRQPERIGKSVIFVLPSTSAAAGKYWDASYWRELADFIGS